jgi:uncharacterized membrane protein YfcA
MFYDLTPLAGERIQKALALEKDFRETTNLDPLKKRPALEKRGTIKTLSFSWRRYTYEFYGQIFSLNVINLFLFTFIIGILGGTYGIGGAAIIAPFLLTFFGLPVYTIAGATLMGNFITSIAGVLFYLILAHFYKNTGISISPDFGLGILFGLGGFMGIYFGAVMQRYFPARIIKISLALLSLLLALEYLFKPF